MLNYRAWCLMLIISCSQVVTGKIHATHNLSTSSWAHGNVFQFIQSSNKHNTASIEDVGQLTLLERRYLFCDLWEIFPFWSSAGVQLKPETKSVCWLKQTERYQRGQQRTAEQRLMAPLGNSSYTEYYVLLSYEWIIMRVVIVHASNGSIKKEMALS